MEENQGSLQQEIHGNQNAISIFGNAHTSICSPPIPSELPARVWMIPYRRNTFFTGQEHLLTSLHEDFINNQEAVLTQGQAVCGLGGIGKTEIVIEYAYRHGAEYRFVFWANASTTQTLIASYVTIADRLQLPERTNQEQNKIVAAVLHWLATYGNWLLILDNADELEYVWPLMPTNSTGHMLVTMRDQMVGDMRKFLVGDMSCSEGALLLLRRAHILRPNMVLEQASQTDRQIAEQITTDVDSLPLALDQAGAYINETGCSPTAYWNRYQRQQRILLNYRGRSGRSYPKSVATTWSLSFKRVEQKNRVAADLLRACAYLAPNIIPEEIFVKGASYLGEQIRDLAEDQGYLDEAIGVLKTYSLIHRDTEMKVLSIHQLVQVVIRESMTREVQQKWKQQVVQAVNATCPDVRDVTQWKTCEQWLPHAQVCANWIEQEQINALEAAHLLNQAGCYLYARGQYAKAESLLKAALSIREQHLGPEYLLVAFSLNNLASLYESQGKYAQAEPLYWRALEIKEQQSVPEHFFGSSLNNLANLYQSQGKYAQAELLYQRALSIGEQQEEAMPFDIASSLNNLACLYQKLGRYSEAELFHQRSLAIYEKILGPEHPEIATILSNLANLYQDQEKYIEAEPLHVRALAIREQQLGTEHPDTSISLNNLACLYQRLGRYPEAELFYQRSLAIREKMLDPEHPGTAFVLENYAKLLQEMQRPQEAVQLKERAQVIRTKNQF